MIKSRGQNLKGLTKNQDAKRHLLTDEWLTQKELGINVRTLEALCVRGLAMKQNGRYRKP